MNTLEVSMVIIKRGESFILQRRPIDPNIGASGLIGCFGGKKEQNETEEDAAYRELFEELDIRMDKDSVRLEHIDDLTVESDYRQSLVTVKAAIFKLDIEKDIVLTAKEGELVEFTLEEIKQEMRSFSPATREAFKNLTRSI